MLQYYYIKHKVELFHNMNFTPDLPKLKLNSNISESFFVFKNNFYEFRITIKFILLHIQSTCGFFCTWRERIKIKIKDTHNPGKRTADEKKIQFFSITDWNELKVLPMLVVGLPLVGSASADASAPPGCGCAGLLGGGSGDSSERGRGLTAAGRAWVPPALHFHFCLFYNFWMFLEKKIAEGKERRKKTKKWRQKKSFKYSSIVRSWKFMLQDESVKLKKYCLFKLLFEIFDINSFSFTKNSTINYQFCNHATIIQTVFIHHHSQKINIYFFLPNCVNKENQ